MRTRLACKMPRELTNPNTVLALLFREPDVCQSVWWGGAQAETGVFPAAASSAGVPEIRLFGFPHLLYSLSAAIYSV